MTLFVNNNNNTQADSPGFKRKRSPGANEQVEGTVGLPYRAGTPQRSITTALVLMMLALGKICEHRGKIPDVINDNPLNSNGSPFSKNGHPPSPLQYSPPPMSSQSSGLPSPQEAERSFPSRRTSTDGPISGTPLPNLRNLDVIPGLAYFAVATDIIGNQLGGNSLQHVHVNILAGLYHGQLGRVLESHAYIHEACRALQVILQP